MSLATLAAGLLACISPTQTQSQSPAPTPEVHLLRVPDRGIQPQALTDPAGTLHLLYYRGDPKAGDLFYTTRPHNSPDFAKPIRVNSQPGSAVAVGNNRGGQLALGPSGRVHVAWNGSGSAAPKAPPSPAMPASSPHDGTPMLYARLNDARDAFEPQRNLMTASTTLDGGGAAAADEAGNVYVVWHGLPVGAPKEAGEAERRVFVAKSTDHGRTFAPEVAVSPTDLGACACCGLAARTSATGQLAIAFRSAVGGTSRDATLLFASDQPALAATKVHHWEINACPMSTFAIAAAPRQLLLAWETSGGAFLAPVTPSGSPGQPIPAPGDQSGRKYPTLAVNSKGHVLLAWTEGMAWNKGGSLRWAIYDPTLNPIPGATGSAEGVPTWSLISAAANPDNSFTLLY